MTQIPRFILAAALFAATSVQAADYDPPIVVDEAPEYQPVEIGSGWYLRGDIGYAFATSAGLPTYRTYNSTSGTYSDNVFATAGINTGINGGVGFGYRFTNYLRLEGMLDILSGSFNGATTSATPCLDPVANPIYVGTTCRSEDSALFRIYSPMVNGYVDLGTYARFTPYVGAGVGAANVQWQDLTNTTYCVDGAAPCPAPAMIASTTHDGLSSWRFSWAVMAGFAYDLTRNTKLDFGYKYRNITGGPMFAFDAATAGAGATGVQGRDAGFGTHEVRLGLRYELW